MYINIITPCSRPENLFEIEKSINIPYENYQWIVVHDSLQMPPTKLLPRTSMNMLHTDENSVSGNAQRNKAFQIVSNNPESWIYFNDDDTTIHPELWSYIKKNIGADFIHFKQENQDGSIRLYGNSIEVGQVDSHNFVFKRKLLGDTQWILDKYDADGYFAKEIYAKAENPVYLNKVLSTYNKLR